MYLLSSMVFFVKIGSLSSFFQYSLFLFDALVHRNSTVGSMSGLSLFFPSTYQSNCAVYFCVSSPGVDLCHQPVAIVLPLVLMRFP